jgi:dTDP-4-dehydrorhamnose 3,5-epimerase
VSVELSAANRLMLWVGHGLAHGFMALEDETELVYALDQAYDPAGQRTILWDDPALAISWPALAPVMSAKDRAGQSLDQFAKGLGDA